MNFGYYGLYSFLWDLNLLLRTYTARNVIAITMRSVKKTELVISEVLIFVSVRVSNISEVSVEVDVSVIVSSVVVAGM